MATKGEPWTVNQLHDLLGTFEAELRAAGLKENTIRTYVDRSTIFVRWLDGDYRPGSREGALGPEAGALLALFRQRSIRAGGHIPLAELSELVRFGEGPIPGWDELIDRAFVVENLATLELTKAGAAHLYGGGRDA
jgi:hypothetical protein